jgi:hypothetical protein
MRLTIYYAWEKCLIYSKILSPLYKLRRQYGAAIFKGFVFGCEHVCKILIDGARSDNSPKNTQSAIAPCD